MFIGEDNIFRNESDVEQKLVMPSLTGEPYLGIPPANVYTKQYLAPSELDKVAGKTGSYVPDYAIWFHGLLTMIVEVPAIVTVLCEPLWPAVEGWPPRQPPYWTSTWRW